LIRSNKALWNGENGGEVKFISAADEKNVVVFSREKDGQKVLVMINMTGNDQNVKLNNPLLAGKYKELFSEKKVKMKAEVETELEAWGYRVYYK
jgi:hypothetical protein